MILSFSQIVIYLDEVDHSKLTQNRLVAGFSSPQRTRGTRYYVKDSRDVNSKNCSVLIGMGKRTELACGTRVTFWASRNGRGSIL